jgi:hypothetical protein
MKNRYFIFSVLFWVVASVCMAVTLPTSSFTAFSGSEDAELSYVSESGISFLGSNLGTSTTSVVYNGTCTYEAWEGDVSGCKDCCEKEFTCGTTDYDCWLLRGACIDQCGEPLGGLPLGTPLLLLPFALAYAVVRRKRMVVE